MGPSLACTPVILLHPQVENPGKKPGRLQIFMMDGIERVKFDELSMEPLPRFRNFFNRCIVGR
jgi:hypothetical protein